MRKIFHLSYSKGQYYHNDIKVYANYFEIKDGVFIFYESTDAFSNKIVACYPVVNTAIWMIEEIKDPK